MTNTLRQFVAFLTVSVVYVAPVYANDLDKLAGEFLSVCQESEPSIDVRIARLKKLEWELSSAQDMAPVGKMLAATTSNLGKEVKILDVQTLARIGNGKQEYVILTDMFMSGTRVLGCNFYDLKSDSQDYLAVVESKFPESPSKTLNNPNVIISHTWSGATLTDGVVSIRLGYVPPDSTTSDALGFSGVALAMTRVK
ncbi:hypothetical protein ACQU0X_03075 [Pseudovibrio ascidiaceicola]|uniref:hypothetical protein n=1 Tax=Pseudovibrio ascidiaceicola TaxID=285279 RepID=UPI003D35BAED